MDHVVMTQSRSSHVIPLLDAVRDLSSIPVEQERYEHLLQHIRKIIPYDSAAFLRLDPDGILSPVAVVGLVPEIMGRRFDPREHPRLQKILEARGAVKFQQDSSMPDPFDGLMSCDTSAELRVHACIGCALRVQDETLGLLVADALAKDAFDGIDPIILADFSAPLALAFKTASLISLMDQQSKRERIIARQLGAEAHVRFGSEFLGASTAAQKIREDIALLARSDLPVLIT